MTTTPARLPSTKLRKGRRRATRLTVKDKISLAVMLGIALTLSLCLVWLPALMSLILSFAKWDGVGGFSAIEPVGTRNYQQIATNYPPFWPALQHNLIWLAFFLVLATPFALLLAVLLDRDLRGSRIYQTALFLPVVLSLALVGFIWQLIYSPEQGLINNLARTHIDWLGDSRINLWAAMVAASWRHVGYIMVIYLAGIKGVDPALREAAAIDGASEVQTFRKIIFPALRSTNIIVLVITIIEALRAFDLVYILNHGRNGLELLSVLITENIIGAATRIGFGSAIAVILLVISLGVIIPYLSLAFQKDAKR